MVVTPCVGVWIEMDSISNSLPAARVTPCVGVWIEILSCMLVCVSVLSLPAWECGLKYQIFVSICLIHLVTPCVGVWIEIFPISVSSVCFMSLPAWECGLKSNMADM